MSAISFHAQVQFHAKYPLFDSQSDREFTFSYAILPGIKCLTFGSTLHVLYNTVAHILLSTNTQINMIGSFDW